MKNRIDFTRIPNDTNGNPRYVCHYLNLISKQDQESIDSFKNSGQSSMSLYIGGREKTGIKNAWDFGYELALRNAKAIGGKRFHNKQFGGGIVFQSYNIQDTERRIFELLETGK